MLPGTTCHFRARLRHNHVRNVQSNCSIPNTGLRRILSPNHVSQEWSLANRDKPEEIFRDRRSRPVSVKGLLLQMEEIVLGHQTLIAICQHAVTKSGMFVAVAPG